MKKLPTVVNISPPREEFPPHKLQMPEVEVMAVSPATGAPPDEFRNKVIYLSAHIFAVTKQRPTIEVDGTDVVFVHPNSSKTMAAVMGFLANRPVPVQDFVAAFKELRTMMYNAKPVPGR